MAGTAAAYGLSRWRWRGRDLLDALLTLPLVLPPTVLGYYLLVLLGRRGVLGETLAGWGIELVFTGRAPSSPPPWWRFRWCSNRPARLSRTSTRSWRTRRGCWACAGGVFFRVTLPLARGIVAGVLLAFARALGESAPR